MLSEVLERLDALEKTIGQIVRVGKVTSTYPARGTVRVELVDSDAMITSELPVLFRKTLKDKGYSMPDINEQVLCVFLPNGLEQGFVLGAMYSKTDPVPVVSQDKWHTEFEDGTILEYDRSTHLLKADVKGDVELKADNLTAELTANVDLKAGGYCKADITGDAEIKSAANCDVLAAGIATIAAPQINIVGKLSATDSVGGGQAVFDNPTFETKGGSVNLASQGSMDFFVLSSFLAFFGLHTHNETGTVTSAPNQPVLPSHQTTNVKGS